MSGTYRMSEQERIHKLVRGEKEKEDGMKGILYIQRQVDFVVSDFCLGETGGQWPCTVGTIEATDLQGDALNANHAPRSLDMYAAAAARSVDSSQERKSPFFFSCIFCNWSARSSGARTLSSSSAPRFSSRSHV